MPTKIAILCSSLVLIASVIVGAFVTTRYHDVIVEHTLNEKQNEIEHITTYIQSHVNELKNDALFLSATPPVSALAKTVDMDANRGANNSDQIELHVRLATIFEEMMYAKTHYQQIKVVSLSTQKDIIRLERVGPKVRQVSNERSVLTGHEDLLRNMYSLTESSAYLSRFFVAMTHDKVQLPISLLQHAAVPIFSVSGQPVALVAITINYNDILKSLKKHTVADADYFVADQEGNILRHTDRRFNLTPQTGSFKKVYQFIPQLAAVYDQDNEVVVKKIAEGGNKVAVTRKLYYNPLQAEEFLLFATIVDTDKLLQRLEESVGTVVVLAIICILSLCGIISIYLAHRLVGPIMYAEKELIAANEKIKAGMESKSRFLANIAHEIRTPMNGIIGSANLIVEHELNDIQKDNLTTIKECGDRLLVLVNDFLDYSKIEAGKLRVEKKVVDVKKLLTDFLPVADKLVGSKDVVIRTSFPEYVPPLMMGDPIRINQILLNLVSNAVKFTENGEVSISVSAKPIENRLFEYRFSVRDTGVGMRPEDVPYLFEEFTQADTSATRKYGGAGLGLAICKRLTELMGGRIWVQSRIGVGSTFYFTVLGHTVDKTAELRSDPQSESPPMPDVDGKRFPLRILVAEDNKINQRIIMGLLEKMDYKADIVENGRQAIDALQKQRYDVVLMDIQMPEMDGLSATHEISKLFSPTDRPVIVGVSANAMPEDTALGLEAGMVDYLTKPVRLPRLAQSLHLAYTTKEQMRRGAA